MAGMISRARPPTSQTQPISVLGSRTPAKFVHHHAPSPPTHYTGSGNYTDTEWREVQGWGQVKETHAITKITDELGRKIINKYEVIREIGRGVHGKVKLARTMDSNEMVALKILPKTMRARLGRPESSTTQEAVVRREIAILKKCVHPHVVRLREVIDDPQADKIYLVLEYMWGGEVIWRNDEDEPVLKLHQARSTFRDTVLGLEFRASPSSVSYVKLTLVHHQGIIHRDIKPANLLWTKNHSVKISDFGVSHISSAVDQSSSALELAKTAGTPAFFAPELCWTGSGERPPITKAIDIWALGVTLYCLLCGKVPFEAQNEFELFERIVSDEIKIPDEVDHDAKDLLSKMLVKDPSKRITIPDIKRHPFVLKGVKDPAHWISVTNPSLFGILEVSETEVYEAVSTFDAFKRRLGKLGSRLATGLRRRATSAEQSRHSSVSASTPEFEKHRSKEGSMMTTTTSNESKQSEGKSHGWMSFIRRDPSAEAKQNQSFESLAAAARASQAVRPINVRRSSPHEALAHAPGTRSQGDTERGHEATIVTTGDALSGDHGVSRHLSLRRFGAHPTNDEVGLLRHSSDPAARSITRTKGFLPEVGTSLDTHLPILSFESEGGSESLFEESESDEGFCIDFDKRRKRTN